MVVSTVDVFCRLSKELAVDNENVNMIEKRPVKRRSKSVHFADSKGLALTSIVLYTKENLSPPPVTRRRQTFHLKDDKRRNEAGQPAQLLNFAANLSYQEVLDKVHKTKVCLENIVCYTFGIYGRIRVKNIAYEKLVSVRYTFDAWQSSTEEMARYIPGASAVDADLFFFHIRPPKTTTDRKMEFAIRYLVHGSEHWDNNYGDNYRLIYFKTKVVDAMNLPQQLKTDPPNRYI